MLVNFSSFSAAIKAKDGRRGGLGRGGSGPRETARWRRVAGRVSLVTAQEPICTRRNGISPHMREGYVEKLKRSLWYLHRIFAYLPSASSHSRPAASIETTSVLMAVDGEL
ncbi:hypothetical protein O3G_MSEX012912 [Manduca sexta]|uniref:Uncharacterized protein n=1 Tax=Manduca sexta TaxID=7130 RepID=A0A921ZR29_MANSE|nr:hypothetical protein O3G_MSEX012912 [Manduca sexta]